MFRKLVSSMLQAKRSKDVETQFENVLLERVPFLQGADREVIHALSDAVETVEFAKGETILREGEPGDCLYLIVEGSVQVLSKGDILAEIGLGGCIGEGALLKDGIRNATVLASEEVTLFQIKRATINRLSERCRQLRFRLRQLQRDREQTNIENALERNLLKNAPFLSGAGGDLINELSRYLEPKTYTTGEVLIEEGATGDALFLIEDGTVGITKSGSPVAELGPGACLGEGALFSRQECSATVTAISKTTCYSLRRDGFNWMRRRYPVFVKKLRDIHIDRR